MTIYTDFRTTEEKQTEKWAIVVTDRLLSTEDSIVAVAYTFEEKQEEMAVRRYVAKIKNVIRPRLQFMPDWKPRKTVKEVRIFSAS